MMGINRLKHNMILYGIFCLLVGLCCLILGGCASNNEPTPKDIAVNNLNNAIMSNPYKIDSALKEAMRLDPSPRNKLIGKFYQLTLKAIYYRIPLKQYPNKSYCLDLNSWEQVWNNLDAQYNSLEDEKIKVTTYRYKGIDRTKTDPQLDKMASVAKYEIDALKNRVKEIHPYRIKRDVKTLQTIGIEEDRSTTTPTPTVREEPTIEDLQEQVEDLQNRIDELERDRDSF